LNWPERILKWLPALLILGSGVVGFLKLSWTMDQWEANESHWQASAETRREKQDQQMDAILTRLTRDETNIEWLEKTK
jgi:hypothetical protein